MVADHNKDDLIKSSEISSLPALSTSPTLAPSILAVTSLTPLTTLTPTTLAMPTTQLLLHLHKARFILRNERRESYLSAAACCFTMTDYFPVIDKLSLLMKDNPNFELTDQLI